LAASEFVFAHIDLSISTSCLVIILISYFCLLQLHKKVKLKLLFFTQFLQSFITWSLYMDSAYSDKQRPLLSYGRKHSRQELSDKKNNSYARRPDGRTDI